MWQMIKENLNTKVKHCCGTYSSAKMGLGYAPEVLDDNLTEMNVDIDEKDDKIGDFMQAGGKLAIVCDGHQFYLTKRIRDGYGNVVAEPSGCIRIGGKVVWKKRKDIRIAIVKDIVSPDAVTVETLDGDAEVAIVSYKALKAA